MTATYRGQPAPFGLELSPISRAILANTPDAMFLMDDCGCHLEVSESACTFTGYSHQELLELGVGDLAPLGHRLDAEIAWAFSLDHAHMSSQFAIRRKDDSLVPTEF